MRTRRIAMIVPPALFILVLSAPPAVAQAGAGDARTDQRPAARTPATGTWQVAAGYRTLSYEDHKDDPVQWVGGGPVVMASRDIITAPHHLHRFEFLISPAGGFSFESPIGAIAAPPADAASYLEGRYEYRRYLFGTRLPQWLDLGVGILANGERGSFTRNLPPAIVAGQTNVSIGGGVAVAGGFHKWRRVGVDAEWANFGTASRMRLRHTAAPSVAPPNWSGGYGSDLTLSVVTPVTRRASIVGSYRGSGGTPFGRHTYAFSRAFTAGVIYGR